MHNLNNKILTKLIERDRYPYPRYFLRLYPHALNGMLNNRLELLRYVTMGKDALSRLFSEYQIAEREYDMLFLDIDDHTDLHIALMKLNVVLERLHDNGVKKYFINFSGSKGFHIYVPFEPVRLRNYRKTMLALLTKYRIVDLVDNSAIEPKRCVRLPTTINTKSKLHCVSLGNELRYNFNQIIRRSINNEHVEFDIRNNIELDKELLQIDGRMVSDEINQHSAKFKAEAVPSIYFTDIEFYPPCIKRLVMLALDGVDLNHIERMEMGKFLMHVYGGNTGKVARFYSLMSDYNPQVTEYQLDYIYQNSPLNLRCESLDDMDICCMKREECLFNPTMNKMVKKDNLLKIQNLKRVK